MQVCTPHKNVSQNEHFFIKYTNDAESRDNRIEQTRGHGEK